MVEAPKTRIIRLRRDKKRQQIGSDSIDSGRLKTWVSACRKPISMGYPCRYCLYCLSSNIVVIPPEALDEIGTLLGQILALH
jgi:hypothetical protein